MRFVNSFFFLRKTIFLFKNLSYNVFEILLQRAGVKG